MAKIFRTTALVDSENAFNEALSYANNYWGNLQLEKMFPIPFWQVKQMLLASNDNEIALRVTNISDPSIVTAKWIVFDVAMADSLRDPVEPNVHYFIFDDTLFFGPILTPDPVGQKLGMINITSTPENNIIRGRIGKNGTTGRYYAFLQAAQCTVITPGGGGPGGATGGARIPANGQ